VLHFLDIGLLFGEELICKIVGALVHVMCSVVSFLSHPKLLR
jgi:hypothetical protein